jgi:hypothetical protein
MHRYSKPLLDRTIRTLQPYCDTPISEEAAAEVLDNLTALFLYLRELEQKYGNEKEENA